MGRPKKPKTVKVVDENDQVVEVTEVGVPGLFNPQECDIQEEINPSINEAFREYLLDRDNF